ncbi:CoF synthetase [Micromonospora sp. WMMA2032]|uniref:phenylacetate--CoA ligase family protein n=1 Tax=unclassified Micromonospora TaxID=2617518 RepID=UPI000C05ABC0|nr:CoF synthetase [Micromonospora sp. WMMA2032]ATO17698.1 CoF synthetase [Micromonospora sp. WMMA2032]
MAETLHRPAVLRTVETPMPAVAALSLVARVVAALVRLVGRRPAGWRWLARHHHPLLDGLAEANARATCVRAARRVPAYRAFLRARPAGVRRRLRDFPETDKLGYVVAHAAAARCWRGRLPRQGVVVDESAGSSGRPFNWPRGERELRAVHRDIAGYTGLAFPMRRPFVINAYSMGAWATGTTTGAAMARIAVVKNTGPDLGKIVDTLREFGPDFDYLVTAYPPFLKHLRDRLDAEDFPWSRYRIFGSCGGEGMTEALRDYLEQRFVRVRSAYGASDLTIGIGAETRFTVWLRRRLRTDAALRAELLGPGEQRLPMVFQYNPFATWLETNERRELVCTVTGPHVLQPRLRYNVGDEALLVPYRRIVELAAADPVRRAEFRTAVAEERMTLPVLLLFGRADSTVSYLGANLYPQDVEYGLYTGNPHAAQISRFCLALHEDAALETRPVIHVELRRPLAAAQRAALADACRDGVRRHLASVSRDFAQSLVEDPTAGDLRVELHEADHGPFAGRQKLKNAYLVR